MCCKTRTAWDAKRIYVLLIFGHLSLLGGILGLLAATYESDKREWLAHRAYINSSPPIAHICVSEPIRHWFRYCLVASSAPSHYLHQYWLNVNWTPPGNRFQWNLNRNSIIWISNSCLPNLRPFCPRGDNLTETSYCKMARGGQEFRC